MASDGEMISVMQIDGQHSEIKLDEVTALSILPLRNIVLMPGAILPVSVTRKKSIKLAREAHATEALVGVCTQKDKEVEDPTSEQLYQKGTVGIIHRVIEMPDNSVTIILEGKKRFAMGEVLQEQPTLFTRVHLLNDIFPDIKKLREKEVQALFSSIIDISIAFVNNSGLIPAEAAFTIRNIDNPLYLINYILVNFSFEVADKQRLLEIDDLLERAYQLLALLKKERELLDIKIDIQKKAHEEMNKQQREYFLHQQMRTIQKELEEEDAVDVETLRERGKKKKWNEQTAKTFERELKKLKRENPHSPDYSTQLNYIETLLNLPWNEYTKDIFNLKKAKRQLDKDHYGMEKVKERILEHLAVLKLKGDMKSPIICLYGPPGVGKTSLGKSIATALGRKYIRVSLGGLHDEAEIRGHRRTYIGALPGRIIQNILKAESANPVFVLDEIDKVSADYKGDPAAALLEVLDPEQNTNFHDNYLDADFDLSKVLFIATANNLNTIPRPLLDRMELIEVSGYTQEEKIEIARNHLLKKEIENHGLKTEYLILEKPVVQRIIADYTRESGVRQLSREIAKMCRKIARKVAENTDYNAVVSETDLTEFLGAPRFSSDQYAGNDYAGVVTGLAWTQVGGEILTIETSLSPSKTPKLNLTGNLGEVMKESAMLALEYVKSHADILKIDNKLFEKFSIHIHVPEGAIPKDGPSAGITMTTALTSLLTRRKVRKNLAMTGEITLRGKVLPVGGIKEKILAAKRAGIKDIILCAENQKDINEIKPIYLKGLHFHYVSDMQQVIDCALLKEKTEK
ncbi:MAG: endopeptidase La [Prevotellaceae bacterium]|nr:endopeptidase La [Prevotellaceae bacterium]